MRPPWKITEDRRPLHLRRAVLPDPPLRCPHRKEAAPAASAPGTGGPAVVLPFLSLLPPSSPSFPLPFPFPVLSMLSPLPSSPFPLPSPSLTFPPFPFSPSPASFSPAGSVEHGQSRPPARDRRNPPACPAAPFPSPASGEKREEAWKVVREKKEEAEGGGRRQKKRQGSGKRERPCETFEDCLQCVCPGGAPLRPALPPLFFDKKR